MNTITIVLDGNVLCVERGKTILEVARENGVSIPTLCYHPDAETEGHCGMCVVEIVNTQTKRYACMTVVEEGMNITTNSDRLGELRKKSLERLFEKHAMKCGDCLLMGRCQLLDLSRSLNVRPVVGNHEGDTLFEADTILFDQSKCIDCGHCANVCPVDFLEITDRGVSAVSKEEEKECINCGQCIIHCPVGAIDGQGEFGELKELEALLQEEGKTVVVQFAPSIRTAIGEEFGMEPGSIATGQLVAGLKKVGFKHVFDTASGADFTTTEEALELAERLLSGENLPAMTSCCPSWVRFVEFYYPEFIPNLCTSRSPQIMLGGILKEYWAKQMSLDSERIFVVSIMPCVSKKYERMREELKIDGRDPVDMVLTTRELARLFKKNNVDLKTIEEESPEHIFGDPSGAGVIYGSSGGVFESALRTAYYNMTGENLPLDAVSEIRGLDGIKQKELSIAGKKVRVCVVNGIKNARNILEELKKDPKKYDAVEVMACPGGCIGGGGQPIPMTQETVQARSKALYTIDEMKKIRCAHENEDVKKAYEEFFTSEDVRKKILHTHFASRRENKE